MGFSRIHRVQTHKFSTSTHSLIKSKGSSFHSQGPVKKGILSKARQSQIQNLGRLIAKEHMFYLYMKKYVLKSLSSLRIWGKREKQISKETSLNISGETVLAGTRIRELQSQGGQKSNSQCSHHRSDTSGKCLKSCY